MKRPETPVVSLFLAPSPAVSERPHQGAFDTPKSLCHNALEHREGGLTPSRGASSFTNAVALVVKLVDTLS